MIKELLKENLDKTFFDLYYEGFMHHYNHRKDLFKKRKIDELKEYVFEQLDNEELKIIGYFLEDKLVGYLAYQIKQKVTKFLWIDEFVVSKNHRGKGYGSLLMEEIKKIAKKEKVKRIELNCFSFNENAVKLYKSLGYKEQRTIYELEME